MAENDSTQALLEGEIIVFPAPNDGSISTIIDPSVEIVEGRLVYDKRDYHIIDEQGNPHFLTLIGSQKLKQIFGIFNSQIESLSTQLSSDKETLEKAREKIALYKRDLLSLKRAIEKIREENRKYKELYGDFANPYLILHELYNGGRIGKYRQLIAPSKFKQKSINTNTKSNREPVQYWLSLLEYWGIFDSDRNIRYASVSFEDAKKILKSKLGEKDEK